MQAGHIFAYNHLSDTGYPVFNKWNMENYVNSFD